jgi:hypothetical protein
MSHDKFPRTMREAFGHYTGDHLIDTQPREAPFWPCLLLGVALILLCAVLL